MIFVVERRYKNRWNVPLVAIVVVATELFLIVTPVFPAKVVVPVTSILRNLDEPVVGTTAASVELAGRVKRFAAVDEPVYKTTVASAI